ncbi:MAG: S-layer homology domain-containing protein [Clostridia bacterium]|nr:S-layer homology domain-containing protein [Clostridia bacterium]
MKKVFFAALLMALGVLLTVAPSALERGTVSHGLAVLARGTDMAKTALVGKDISLTREDFCRALNLKSVEKLTIVSTPAPEDGSLMVGRTSVTSGQEISGGNLDLLTFVPNSPEIKQSSFEFSVHEGYSIKCNLYFVEKTNYSPTVSLASESALAKSTHDMVSRMGRLSAYDPEGDSFVYEVVSYPKNGSVVMISREEGRYVYTPREDFSGSDSFTYVARDIYGNYSSSATVTFDVKARRSSAAFGDIDDCNIYNAALTMAENGLMTGSEIDGVIYFAPDQGISRAEFLALAMKSVGINDPGKIEKTVFADDDDIPGEYKGYVASAYELGFISGTEAENGDLCFMPNSGITRAEAAVMLKSVLGADKTNEKSVILPVFADSGDLPFWASDAIYSMNSLGVFHMIEGYAAPSALVTRGDAAQMLEAVINIFG